MIRVFKHYLPYAVLLLGTIDFVLLMLAAEAGWTLRLWQVAGEFDPDGARWPNMLAFTMALQGAMVAVGVYGVQALQSVRCPGGSSPALSGKAWVTSRKFPGRMSTFSPGLAAIRDAAETTFT